MKTQYQCVNDENCKDVYLVKTNKGFFVVAKPQLIRGTDIPIYIEDFENGKYEYGHLGL